jgi:hypothetical protein
MEILIAIAHVVGSIIAVTLLGIFVLFLGAWEVEQIQKRRLEELSVQLGVKVKDLGHKENLPKVLKISSARYSTELFRNRLSDLCDVIRTVWSWVAIIIQISVITGVIWYTVTEGYENAIFAWSIVGISVFFWIVGVVFAILCKLVTGRYPGEAKTARKAAAELLNNSKGG